MHCCFLLVDLPILGFDLGLLGGWIGFCGRLLPLVCGSGLKLTSVSAYMRVAGCVAVAPCVPSDIILHCHVGFALLSWMSFLFITCVTFAIQCLMLQRAGCVGRLRVVTYFFRWLVWRRAFSVLGPIHPECIPTVPTLC